MGWGTEMLTCVALAAVFFFKDMLQLGHGRRLFYDTKNRRILRQFALRNPVFLMAKNRFS